MMDEQILVYEGVVIRKSDRRILETSSYLNDRIIEFYFSYLSWCYSTDDILLIPPSLSLSIANSSDPGTLKETISPLKLDNKELIFFPVIDCDEDEEGSHWSLLVYYRKMHSFIHHDSLGGINDFRARRLYEKVKDFVGFGGSSECKSLRNPLTRKNKRTRSEAWITACFTPQKAMTRKNKRTRSEACTTECFTPQQALTRKNKRIRPEACITECFTPQQASPRKNESTSEACITECFTPQQALPRKNDESRSEACFTECFTPQQELTRKKKRIRSEASFTDSFPPQQALRRKTKRIRSEACFTECFTPQQADGHDSGLYLMVFADVICGWFTSWSMRESLFWLSTLESRVNGSYVELNMRAEILELLDKLKEEYCYDSC